MKLKKINAVLALITTAFLICHLGYNLVTYVLFYYNPVLSMISGILIATCFVLHGVLAVFIVIHSHDSKTVEYKKLNLRTVIQRITAAVIMVLLPFHALEMALLSKNIGNAFYVVLEVLRFAFYLSVMLHVCLSFSNALVTLGLLGDMKKKKILDRILLVVAILFGICFGIYVTVMHLIIFGVIQV